MRVVATVVLSIVLFACSEGEDGDATTLVRTEAKSYTGYVWHTIYEHDPSGRITSIKEHKDDEEPVVKVTITYDGNDVLLLSTLSPEVDMDQTKSVVFTLDERGRPRKRIEYTHQVPNTTTSINSETLLYDTLFFEYDASGFLIKTEGTRYDSSWTDETHYQVMKATSYTEYNVESGNLKSTDEFVDFPVYARNGASTTYLGGHLQRHNVFHYDKSFPNKADFRNAIILNEYKEEFEPLLDEIYANMPEAVTQISKVWDVDGNVLFDHEWETHMDRIYNGDGMLASRLIPLSEAQYIETNYFYH